MRSESGQALVTLVVFTAIATVVITGAVMATIVNSQATSKFAQGEQALQIAESGAENAIIRLLRDPNYGETPDTISVGNGQAQIAVMTVGESKTIISQGENGSFKRRVEVSVSYVNNKLTVTSWKEID